MLDALSGLKPAPWSCARFPLLQHPLRQFSSVLSPELLYKMEDQGLWMEQLVDMKAWDIGEAATREALSTPLSCAISCFCARISSSSSSSLLFPGASRKLVEAPCRRDNDPRLHRQLPDPPARGKHAADHPDGSAGATLYQAGLFMVRLSDSAGSRCREPCETVQSRALTFFALRCLVPASKGRTGCTGALSAGWCGSKTARTNTSTTQVKRFEAPQ